MARRGMRCKLPGTSEFVTLIPAPGTGAASQNIGQADSCTTSSLGSSSLCRLKLDGCCTLRSALTSQSRLQTPASQTSEPWRDGNMDLKAHSSSTTGTTTVT